MKGTAWAYLVVSSSAQRDTLPDQEAWAKETADRHGWTITNTFKDASTGRDGVRGLLEKLLAELRATPKADRPERILMTRLDRLGRGDGLDPIAKYAEIRKLGVIIHDRVHGDRAGDSMLETLAPVLELLVGAWENVPRRDKTLNAHRRRVAAGQHWVAPYGLRVTESLELEPDEPAASIVREAFALRAQGWGYNALGARFRTVAAGRAWGRSSVYDMLHRETYRGTVVDVELFDRVQAMVGMTYASRAKQRFPWPLAKALRCASCRHLLHGEASGRAQWRTRYYVCDNLGAHGGRLLFHAEHLEAQFLDGLRTLAATPALIEEYRRRPATARASLNVRLTELESERMKIDAQREYVWTMQVYVDPADVAERLTKLRTEEARVTEAIDDLKREITAAAQTESILRNAAAILERMAAQWSTLPVDEQQRAARAVATVFPVIVHDDDPTRVRGPRARRNSARGRVEFCVQAFENGWTEASTRLAALAAT